MFNLSMNIKPSTSPKEMSEDIAVLKAAFLILSLSVPEESTIRIIDTLSSADHPKVRDLGVQLKNALESLQKPEVIHQ
jgi:hypothetical protein